MLPFLKQKPVAGLILQKQRTPDSGDAPESSQDEQDQGLMSAAEDFLRAVESKDAQGVASAMRAAFEILDSEPHEEGPHIEASEEGRE